VRAKGALRPRQLLDRLWFDSVLHDDGALRHLVDVVGAERVVLGSDYPFPMRLDRPVEAVDAIALTDADRAAVLAAAGLLGEFSPPSPSSPSAPRRPAPGARWSA
jgi:aminocarboxymuconate-semialdehyde decarboxylase